MDESLSPDGALFEPVLPARTDGRMLDMAYASGEVSQALSDALVAVLGEVPRTAGPVVILAWFLDALAKGYGLSESLEIDGRPLDRISLPELASGLVAHYLAGSDGVLREDSLRQRLYAEFVAMSEDATVRSTLNRNQPLSEVGMLYLAQIYWNLEGNDLRPRLPIRAGQSMSVGGRSVPADIKVPGASKDFATMKWAPRVNERGSYRSSGQSFRNQGARLAVLTAVRLVAGTELPPPSLAGISLEVDSAEKGAERVKSIVWPPDVDGLAAQLGRLSEAPVGGARILVGRPLDVGPNYQPRDFDDAIDTLWAEGGDRRVWLVGGPGLGKSYTAGRVVQETLQGSDPNSQALIIWVNSADPAAVIDAFADAAERIQSQGWIQARTGETARAKADALIEALATVTWPWLIILDNADASALIQAELLPPGWNPHGRLLVTTLRHDGRMAAHGRQVQAGLFNPHEATDFLRRAGSLGSPWRHLLDASLDDELAALADTVGHHPLALAIAASTITANAMTIQDWISDFTRAADMDSSADEPDPGGYPHQLGATWLVALEKASQGMPAGTVARAALVAALQDPDGHPTWLWESEEVTYWVTGTNEPAGRGRAPQSVRRLIDHGILALRGDTWVNGRLSIHQLAARAVREASKPSMITGAATIIVEQWLLRLTHPDGVTTRDVRLNLRPMRLLAELPKPTSDALIAMTAYGEPADAENVLFDRALVDHLEPFLTAGGATGRLHIVRELVELGDGYHELGLEPEATRSYRRAMHWCHQVLEDPSSDESARADALEELGRLENTFGDTQNAHAHSTEAAQILERQARTREDAGELLTLYSRLSALYRSLGQPTQLARIDAQVGHLLRAMQARTTADPVPSRARDLWVTGSRLQELGKLEDAKTYLSRAADGFREAGRSARIHHHQVMIHLARVNIKARQWTEAEAILTALEGSRQDIILASVQKRLGRVAEAKETLKRAAKEEPRPRAGAPITTQDREDALLSLSRAHLRAAGSFALDHRRWNDATALFRSLLLLMPADTYGGDFATQEVADAHAGLGVGLYCLDRRREALNHLQRAAALEDLLAPPDPNEETLRNLAVNHTKLALCHDALQEEDEALVSYAKAVELLERVNSPTEHGLVADLYHKVGRIHMRRGSTDEAAKVLDLAMERWETEAERSPTPETRAKLARARSDAAYNKIVGHQPDEAVGLLEACLTDSQRLLDDEPADETMQLGLARALALLGAAHHEAGRPDDAARHLGRAVKKLELLASLAPERHGVTWVQWLRALAEMLVELGRTEESDAANTQADEFEQQHPDLHH